MAPAPSGVSEISPPPPGRGDWLIGFAPSFEKSCANKDRKLLGAVFNALTEICRDPMQLRGDTVKPLAGDLKGCWRYRLGDYRLTYHPDPERRRILLLDLSPRSGAY